MFKKEEFHTHYIINGGHAAFEGLEAILVGGESGLAYIWGVCSGEHSACAIYGWNSHSWFGAEVLIPRFIIADVR